jgi:hypothetical protein
MKTRASLFLISILATGAGACGNRLLVGNDSDGGSPPQQTGAAGTGSPPTSGASGTGGLTGVAGTGFPTEGVAGTGGLTGVAGTGGLTGAGGTGSPMTGAGGTGGGVATRVVTPLRIKGDEAVTRIASVLWQEAPSEDLLSQAQLGHFTTTDDLYGAVRQMLADPRASKGIAAFYRWWLHLDTVEGTPKDPKLFPEYDAQLARDMVEETTTFGVNVTLSAGGVFPTLMTAPYSYLNASLAKLYGAPPPAGTGATFQKTQLDPKQRAGLLTQPSLQVLSSYEARNSPPRRGTYMLNVFQCMEVPPSPPNITGLGDVTNMTVRQALAASVGQQSVCAACHAMIDPPGLAFETLDAIGRWRTTDNGFPVDTSGLRIMNLTDDGSPVMVEGPVQLAGVMASSRRVQDCFARKWIEYAAGKSASQDEGLVQYVAGLFQGSSLNLKELIALVLSTDAFLAPMPH